MRRLPVYFVIETSGGMVGDRIEEVRNGLQVLVSLLRQNPYALEIVYLSIITFDSSAQQLTPLTELAVFQVPPLSGGGAASMGASLKLVSDKMTTEVKKTEGDYKPWVFFVVIDGEATDNLQTGIAKFKKVETGLVIAFQTFLKANLNVLTPITETVIKLDYSDTKALFKWVAASIALGAEKADSGEEIHSLSELPPLPPELMIS